MSQSRQATGDGATDKAPRTTAVLCFLTGMEGKLVLEDGVTTLAELAERAERRRLPSGADVLEVPLPDGARGQVKIGDSRLLF